MAEIKRYPVFTHLRSEPNVHVIRYRNGEKVASGKGLAFWFVPLGSGLAEIPTDDRELQFMFHGRSSDFQAITVQGELTYRVTDAERLAGRIDFSIDIDKEENRYCHAAEGFSVECPGYQSKRDDQPYGSYKH